MKKKTILGILAIVLTVVACYIAYYRFWMAIAGFAIATAVLPVAFWLVKSKAAWFSIPFAVALELVLYWPLYCNYEGRSLLIYATLSQILVMAAGILAIKRIATVNEK